MTDRLYYNDSFLTSFEATVVETSDDGRRVYLDRTAFYPTSGGQPHDLGQLNGIAVTDVLDEDERIAHILVEPLRAATVEGVVAWERRFDFMQQHTGQHLLSAVFEAALGFKTVAVHFSEDTATVELATPALTAAQVQQIERRANALVAANLPVTVVYEHASVASGLCKATEREGDLRIVSIEGLDRSACGGTHVRATGEIGCILLRKAEKLRGNTRVEFLCGLRAVARARADYDALAAVARVFSSTLDDAPALVASLNEQARESDKSRRKLVADLAAYRARELYAQSAATASGRRVHVARVRAMDDETKALANGFIAQPQAVFIAVCANPPGLLLAASADADIHAGNVLKERLAAHGGRGGGSASIAQGSLPSTEATDALAAEIAAYL